MTIVISSHLLSEIEKMVTHIGIISKGCLLFQGSIEELQALQRKQSMLRVKTSDNDTAYHLLYEWSPERTWHELLVPYQSVKDIAAINRILTSHPLDVYLLHPNENSLEQLFIELTTHKL